MDTPDTTDTKTSHFYLRTLDHRPIGVVALRPEGDDQYRIAISLCHPNDPWNATYGIAAARARLDSDRQGRSRVVKVTKHEPLLINIALELKPHGTAAKDQSVGIDWAKAQGIFHRYLEHMRTPAPESSPS